MYFYFMPNPLLISEIWCINIHCVEVIYSQWHYCGARDT